MSALYDQIGTAYSQFRRPDQRIAGAIEAALAGCATIVNVGAGAGSYEPQKVARVVAVEPSRTMIVQRRGDAAPVVQAVGERLPFADDTFDAALAVLTVHHWSDAARGLAEMRRVARRQVVLTWDRAVAAGYWLVTDYLPEIAEREAAFATVDTIAVMLNATDVRVVPVPHDCTDGFMAAYWRRPERYLEPAARSAISGIALIDHATVARTMRALAQDLASGAWHARHGDLLEMDADDAGYRLVVGGRSRDSPSPGGPSGECGYST
jgi:SAM-dependent methyltransferase